MIIQWLLTLVSIYNPIPYIYAQYDGSVLGCNQLQNCTGHGTCNYGYGECICDNGWGSPSDTSILGYRPTSDCSKRVCPFGKAWGDIPLSSTQAHAKTECSNMGLCDRVNGTCGCFPGFRGPACEYTTCPGNNATHSWNNTSCSGHGRCVSMRIMARMDDGGLPLVDTLSRYGGDVDTVTWDQDRIFGCVCDSSWSVGLGSGETQVAEWFGPDCSLRHCPSGDNPDTAIDETDCSGVVAEGGYGTGQAGNLCYNECSSQGTCNHTLGTCDCYDGYDGAACEQKLSRAKKWRRMPQRMRDADFGLSSQFLHRFWNP